MPRTKNSEISTHEDYPLPMLESNCYFLCIVKLHSYVVGKKRKIIRKTRYKRKKVIRKANFNVQSTSFDQNVNNL